MAEYECSCGFSANRAARLHAHLNDHKGQGHDIVAYGAYGLPAPASTTPPQHGGTEESLADLLARMPPPPKGPVSPSPEAQSSRPHQGARASPARRQPLLDSSSSSASSSDLDAAWEAVKPEDTHGAFAECSSSPDLPSPQGYQQSTPSSDTQSPATPVGDLPGDRGLNPRMSLAAGALTRVSDLLWRRPSLASTPVISPAHGRAGLPAFQVTADTIEAVLLWEDAWLSARVLFLGMYVLICFRQLAQGVHAVQPTTALALGALGVLGYNAVHRAWQERKIRAGKLQELQPQQAEAAVQQHAKSLLMQAAGMAAPTLAACYVVLRRRLSGVHDSPATAVWTGLALWGIACLGELRLLGQATYACALWAALFSVPLTYTICRTALDALVAEGLALGAQVMGPEHRGVAGLAGLAGVFVASMVSASWVVKASIGATTCTAIICWRCYAQPGGLGRLERSR